MTDTHSEQHRHSCEVRMVAAWPLEQRQRYLAGIKSAARVERIKADLRRLWDERRAA